MRYLGLDFGDRKVGFAVGDDENGIAFARETVRYDQQKQLLSKIAEYVQVEYIDEIVLGYPRDLKSNSTEQTRKVEDFKKVLESHFDLIVRLQDERLTSFEAKEKIKNGANHDEDAIAAQIILQEYMNRLGKK